MTFLDRLLQRWRIRKAASLVPADCRILDIGCHEGEMLKMLQPKISYGLGIDPLCMNAKIGNNIRLIQGHFPAAVVGEKPFDVITALALIEHIPPDKQTDFFKSCFQLLKPGGLLICTIPHRNVDHILAILTRLKLVKGMSLEEHHGFDVKSTPALAAKAGFRLYSHETFQFGLNNLFVFQQSSDPANL